MQQNGQPQPSNDRANPWKLTLGEAALGMAFFILLWTTGLGYMSWYEVVQNTTDSGQETYHAIVTCAAAVTLSAAALSVTTIIGTKTLSAMLKHFSRRD